MLIFFLILIRGIGANHDPPFGRKNILFQNVLKLPVWIWEATLSKRLLGQ